MKIQLTAFEGKLKSEPMEMPDNTSPDFYMPLPVEQLAYQSGEGTFENIESTTKRALFRRTNHSWDLRDIGYKPAKGEDCWVKVYKLYDIN